MTYLPQQIQSGGFISFPSVATAQYDPSVPTRSRGVFKTPAASAPPRTWDSATTPTRILRGTYYMRQRENAAYFQDNFRVTSRLMLNLGVRWQFTPFPKEKHNVFSSFDVKNMAVVLPDGLEPLYQAGLTSPSLVRTLESYGAKFETAKQAGMPPRLIHNNWFDAGPHVGFAYRAFDGGKSFVIRGGTSVNYYPLPMWIWNDNFRANMPFRASYTNSGLTAANQSPDGQQNWGLVSAPTIVAGKNSTSIIDLNSPSGIVPAGNSFQTYFFDPDQPTSRVYDWNFTLEKEIMKSTVVRAGYVGNHGAAQELVMSLNEAVPNYVWLTTTRKPYPTGTWSSAQMRPLNTASANTTLPWGTISKYTRDGWSDSHGIQIEVQRRLTKGIGYQVFYNLTNAIRAGANSYNADSTLSPVSSFLPGAVPEDTKDRARLLLLQRDTTVPKHQIRWNWVASLPFGRGKAFGRNMNPWLDAVVGGWQLTGMGSWRSYYFSLPTSIWPTGTPVEYYGHKYKIEDCRSGSCIPGYLMWNGYIPAHQINSVDAKTGKPNGIMGVPANYKPAAQPLWPYPADYPNRSRTTDPNYGYYGTNTVMIPLGNGTTQEVALGGLHPWINQPMGTTNNWTVDASINKNFNLNERAKLRIQLDAFNVTNTPGNSYSPGSMGLIYTNTNLNTARQLQLSARINW